MIHTKEAYREAEQCYQEALEIRKALYSEPHLGISEAVNNLGVLHFDEGNYFKAEPFFRQALTMKRKVFDDDSPNISEINNLANTLYRTGRFEEAEVLLIKALSLVPTHGDIEYQLDYWGQFMQAQGDYQQAEGYFRQVLEGMKKKEAPLFYIARAQFHLGEVLRLQGRYAEAGTLLQVSRAGHEEVFGHENTYIARALNNEAQILDARGDPAGAEPIFHEALRIYATVVPAKHPFVAEAKSGLGACLVRMGRFAEAEPLLLEGYETLVEQRSGRHVNTRHALENVVALYQAWGKPAQAEKYRALLTLDE